MIWIGIAGVIGALLRYGIGEIIPKVGGIFPVSTLLINWGGCFLLSWFSMWSVKHGFFTPTMRTAISTGFIGSFTTFSTFSVELIQLIQQHVWLMAILYFMLSALGGLFFAWCGWRIGER
ncbi:CrcB protein [Thermoflavimicrobium dichotomicum]|uniref:Fluoride-specific ion channel FluC n=1 Tax=Thermoflavimicrobium dichotomicum TaxID=46223 RepID=A0A1I3M078_9BACL|nr:CrcB protein [Thermoflavimicrobium dichotomicum]